MVLVIRPMAEFPKRLCPVRAHSALDGIFAEFPLEMGVDEDPIHATRGDEELDQLPVRFGIEVRAHQAMGVHEIFVESGRVRFRVGRIHLAMILLQEDDVRIEAVLVTRVSAGRAAVRIGDVADLDSLAGREVLTKEFRGIRDEGSEIQSPVAAFPRAEDFHESAAFVRKQVRLLERTVIVNAERLSEWAREDREEQAVHG